VVVVVSVSTEVVSVSASLHAIIAAAINAKAKIFFMILFFKEPG
jgi:hypothetical protein